MKTLNRTLCLALALVMSISLMASAGAVERTFTDSDQITHSKAVERLVTLGVIDGIAQGDGNYQFQPDAPVDRASMTKLITLLLNGGKEPVIEGGQTPYTDAADSWAADYIAYCSGLGIVAGRGSGRFDPTAAVTAQEAAKMLLVALGYDSARYSGEGWAANVAEDAGKEAIALYADLTLSAADTLDRDDAAQMIYNALYAATADGSTLAADKFGLDENGKEEGDGPVGSGSSNAANAAGTPEVVTYSYFYLLPGDYTSYYNSEWDRAYYTYPAIVNGRVCELLVYGDYQAEFDQLAVNTIYKTKSVKDSMVAGAEPIATGDLYYTGLTGVGEASNGIILLGSQWFSYTEDTQVFEIDEEGEVTVSSIEGLAADAGAVVNAVVTKEGGGELAVLYVAK